MEQVEYSTVSFSTIVYCAQCKGPSEIYGPMMQKAGTQIFYHPECCVSDDDKEKDTETVVRKLFIVDDLNVKSEGN